MLFRQSSLPVPLLPSLVRLTDREFGRTGDLFRCERCGFLSADRATAERIQELYVDVVDEEYTASAESRRHSFASLISSILAKGATRGSLLDIGAGIGLLCEAARSAGFEATGIEPSAWAVDQARARGVSMLSGYFPHDLASDERFEVITVVDVLEHVSDPVGFLRAARKHLSSTGLLVVVTPDLGSLMARLMGSRWWGLRPGHIGYFDVRTMDLAMRSAGLRPTGSQTFGRTFPLGYLIARLGDLAGLPGTGARLAGSRWMKWLSVRTIRLDLRDTRVFFATMGDTEAE